MDRGIIGASALSLAVAVDKNHQDGGENGIGIQGNDQSPFNTAMLNSNDEKKQPPVVSNAASVVNDDFDELYGDLDLELKVENRSTKRFRPYRPVETFLRSTLAQPPQSIGRGRAATLPAWMTRGDGLTPLPSVAAPARFSLELPSVPPAPTVTVSPSPAAATVVQSQQPQGSSKASKMKPGKKLKAKKKKSKKKKKKSKHPRLNRNDKIVVVIKEKKRVNIAHLPKMVNKRFPEQKWKKCSKKKLRDIVSSLHGVRVIVNASGYFAEWVGASPETPTPGGPTSSSPSPPVQEEQCASVNLPENDNNVVSEEEIEVLYGDLDLQMKE